MYVFHEILRTKRIHELSKEQEAGERKTSERQPLIPWATQEDLSP